MAIEGFVDRQPASAAEAQLARVAAAGSARHPHLDSLVDSSGPESARDLADAVHMLCSVHGLHPGLVDMALASPCGDGAKQWLARAAEAFERERIQEKKWLVVAGDQRQPLHERSPNVEPADDRRHLFGPVD